MTACSNQQSAAAADKEAWAKRHRFLLDQRRRLGCNGLCLRLSEKAYERDPGQPGTAALPPPHFSALQLSDLSVPCRPQRLDVTLECRGEQGRPAILARCSARVQGRKQRKRGLSLKFSPVSVLSLPGGWLCWVLFEANPPRFDDLDTLVRSGTACHSVAGNSPSPSGGN